MIIIIIISIIYESILNYYIEFSYLILIIILYNVFLNIQLNSGYTIEKSYIFKSFEYAIFARKKNNGWDRLNYLNS